MRRIAIIPARGGSKRLPRKNIIDFMGKPMIAWTIEAALESECFERVIVSTEDKEIATIAANYGADIDNRDLKLSGDSAKVVDVCLNFLDREEKQNRTYDILCCLYATAPMRFADDIKAVVDMVIPDDCDYAIAATNFDLPVHQALKCLDNNFVTPLWPKLVNKRSDEVDKLVVDAGSTYAVSTEKFRRDKTFYGENMKAHIMPRSKSQDIDEEHDLEIARFYAEKLLQDGNVS